MKVTLEQLQHIMPKSNNEGIFLAPLNAAMIEFGITNENRVEMFLAQLAHESNQMNAFAENLNYSAQGLINTWPTRFTSVEAAQAYARQPEKIANKVYANRGGNGNEASGDGWRFRGAGLIGLTFYRNHKRCAEYFGLSVAKVGDWLRTPEGACRSAAWFWKMAGCNELADAGDFDGVSDAINIGHQTNKEGDAIGYKDRLAFYHVTQEAIA